MRLTITECPAAHTEGCTAVATSITGEILSGGDDFAVWRWNSNGEAVGKVAELESCVTVVAWLGGGARGSGAGRHAGAKDIAVAGCADGNLRYLNVSATRVEKVIAAHTGAVTGIAFSPDGSSMVTTGEDGLVKVWSQTGTMRSLLASCGRCVYTVVWGTESTEYQGECIVYCCGSDATVKPMNPAVRRQLRWKAHSGVVLCADWSRMSNVIVTGGEDGNFKVWDPYGRNIFSSAAGEYPITSIAFAPDGDLFAVGSFHALRICDKTGWSHCVEHTATGSVLAMQWTADGTQLAFGGGSGSMAIAQLVDRTLNWANFTVSLVDGRRLRIYDVQRQTVEELEWRDKITKMALGYGYLVVCTTTQCIVYDVSRSVPVQFDIREAVITLCLTEKQFLLADCSQGLQIFSYEGRQRCTIKLAASLRPEIIGKSLIALSPDTIAARDPADSKRLLFFDTSSGRPLKDLLLTHHMEILECVLSQGGVTQDRKIAFVDRNRELYLTTVHTKLNTPKLATMVSSVKWHDMHEVVTAIADGQLVTWFLPSAIFTDRDLLPMTKHIRHDDGIEAFSRNDQIQEFTSTRVGVRRGNDGALLCFALSPYPLLLLSHIVKHDWDVAIRLCRFIDDKTLWAMITILAIRNGELNAAEVGYAALDDIDKVRYIRWLRDIPTPEGRTAELALFSHRLSEAERILMQANLIYRAVDLHIRLGSWERALDIAIERRTHIDTVLARRQRYLDTVGKKENIDKFLQLADSVTVDWDAINEKIKQEEQKERQRPGAKPYSSK